MLGTSTLRRILRRAAYSPQYSVQMGGVVALVGRFVDIAAALTGLSFRTSGSDRKQLRNLAVTVARIRTDVINRRIPGAIQFDPETKLPPSVPLLREMENTLSLIPQAFAGSRSIGRVRAVFGRHAGNQHWSPQMPSSTQSTLSSR